MTLKIISLCWWILEIMIFAGGHFTFLLNLLVDIAPNKIFIYSFEETDERWNFMFAHVSSF
jgi:hypothetical protein